MTEIAFSSEDTVFSDAQSKAIRQKLWHLLIMAKKDVCPACHSKLDMTHVDMYRHQYGWVVLDGCPKQWLSIQCDNCEYEVSLTKLGIKR